MSLLRTIKQQLGLSSTTDNNFLLDASADNGTMKLSRESGQDIMTVDAAGKPRFNQLAQSLTGSGYKELDGGLIIQWGYSPPNGFATHVIIFPKAMPNFRSVICQRVTQDTTTVQTGQVTSVSSTELA